MGATTALYSATCFAHGKYGNGNPYPVNLSLAVGLSGWLPCARSLKNKIESSQEAAQKASSLPLLLCHGKADVTELRCLSSIWTIFFPCNLHASISGCLGYSHRKSRVALFLHRLNLMLSVS